MKKSLLYIAAIAAMGASFCSCVEESETFDNKAYITSNEVTSILLKGETDDKMYSIVSGIANPVDFDVNINYVANTALVDTYNKAYYEQAQLLPTANYSITEPNAVIPAGSVSATAASITFTGLADLDRDIVYVLPVEAKSSNIEFLGSKKVTYFVIRGAALINVVANLSHNYLQMTANAPLMSGISQLTVECLVKADEFGKLISTICGIEGNFLIRIGDAGVPDDQIQLATSNGNVTDAAWTVPIGDWTHIALTFDRTNGATEVYMNGVKKGNTQYSSYRSTVNWNVYTGDRAFLVGKSYDDNRWFEGDMCELRIWNRILSADELNERNHFYTVDSAAEGLVAYWKFDEGAGNVITDYVNGYNLTANDALTWHDVELPAKK